jgi:hypothetical protein
MFVYNRIEEEKIVGKKVVLVIACIDACKELLPWSGSKYQIRVFTVKMEGLGFVLSFITGRRLNATHDSYRRRYTTL